MLAGHVLFDVRQPELAASAATAMSQDPCGDAMEMRHTKRGKVGW